jgi:peptidoglycan/LPS O-acetylase OafA/YrhL
MPGGFASSSNFIDFMIKRLRRLLPGLIACSYLTVYVIGAIFTTPLLHYLTSHWTFETFVQWSLFLGRSIPGVFDNFILPGATNGSLWSLPAHCWR